MDETNKQDFKSVNAHSETRKNSERCKNRNKTSYGNISYPFAELWELQERKMFSDIEIVCDSGRISSHRFLLTLSFPSLMEQDCDLLLVPWIKLETLRAALQHLYLLLDSRPLRSLLYWQSQKGDGEDISDVTFSNAKTQACSNKSAEGISTKPDILKPADSILECPAEIDTMFHSTMAAEVKVDTLYTNSEDVNDEKKILGEQKTKSKKYSMKGRRKGEKRKKRKKDQNPLLQDFEKGNEIVCDTCGLEFKSRKNLHEHKLTHSSLYGTYACPECSKLCATPRTLKDHLKWHQGLPKVCCSICNKKLSSQAILQRHIIAVHHNIRKYSCQLCGHRATTVGNLQQHINSTHLGIKHQCPTCQELFASKASLYTHQKCHSDERLFVCQVCGLSFKSKRNLQVHVGRKHVTSHQQEQLFQCSVCSKVFKSQASLDYHSRYHRPDLQHPCEACGKRFVTRTKLKQHINTHTGDRPYRCPTTGCSKAFPSSDQLSHHKKSCRNY